MFYQNMLKAASSTNQRKTTFTGSGDHPLGGRRRKIRRTWADHDRVGQVIEVGVVDRVGSNDSDLGVDTFGVDRVAKGVECWREVWAGVRHVEHDVDANGHKSRL